jgi:predicted RNase H-like nuclease (RuvC/YqgF family)
MNQHTIRIQPVRPIPDRTRRIINNENPTEEDKEIESLEKEIKEKEEEILKLKESIESLYAEDSGIKIETLADQMKLDFIKENWNRLKLEDLEKLF